MSRFVDVVECGDSYKLIKPAQLGYLDVFMDYLNPF